MPCGETHACLDCISPPTVHVQCPALEFPHFSKILVRVP